MPADHRPPLDSHELAYLLLVQPRLPVIAADDRIRRRVLNVTVEEGQSWAEEPGAWIERQMAVVLHYGLSPGPAAGGGGDGR